MRAWHTSTVTCYSKDLCGVDGAVDIVVEKDAD